MKYIRTKLQLPLISILLAGGPVFADRPLDSAKAEAAHAHLMGKREFLGLDQRHAFKVRNGNEDYL